MSEDERKLTVIVVPHGDLETRSFAISYGRLRFLFGAGVAAFLLQCVFLAVLFPLMAQAARVKGLERDLEQLEAERAKVAELAQTLAEVEAQYEKVRQMLGADAPVAGEAPTLPPLRGQQRPPAKSQADSVQKSSGLTVWPVPGQRFVTRALNAGRSRHPGLDIAAPLHTEVRAAGDGVVVRAGEEAVYGRYVVVDHGGGLVSLYGHASRLYVEAGERVHAGDIIALSGSTGRSTAPHLHFEVRLEGEPVDPRKHVRER